MSTGGDIEYGGSRLLGGADRSLKGALPPKSSTTRCSTLYVSSTLTQPNNDELSLGVATVLHCQMLQDSEAVGVELTPAMAHAASMFEEGSYMTVAAAAESLAALSPVSPIEEVYDFIRRTFELAKFSPECNLLSLVLINRLVAFTRIPLTSHNWRLLLLSALLVAQKVWDDRSLANVDFPTVWEYACGGDVTRPHCAIDVKVVNQLERKFLELLQYNVTVSASLYAKYYFELRSLAVENKLPWRLEPLSKDEGRSLEIISNKRRDEFRVGKGCGVGVDYVRSHTVADLMGTPAMTVDKGRAVLS